MHDVNMADWFTIETIDRDTFAISEYKHWEETHCYLSCGAEKAVLIDTGLGVDNIKRMVDSLTSLPVMVITTHIRLYLIITRFSRGYCSRFYMMEIICA